MTTLRHTPDDHEVTILPPARPRERDATLIREILALSSLILFILATLVWTYAATVKDLAP